MRPKKNILLVDADEAALSRMKFVLETKGKYRVITESSRAMAEVLLVDQPKYDGKSSPYDAKHLYLVIWSFDKRDGAELMQSIERVKGETKVLMTSRDVKQYPAWMRADCFLPVLGNEPEWKLLLLDQIRNLCARKRGPKKSWKVLHIEEEGVA